MKYTEKLLLIFIYPLSKTRRDIFVPRFVEIRPMVLKKTSKMYQQKKRKDWNTERCMVKLSPDKKWSEENHLNFQLRCAKILNVTSAMCICSIQCFLIIVIAARLLCNYCQNVDQRVIRTCISTCRHRHFKCLWFGSTSKKL